MNYKTLFLLVTPFVAAGCAAGPANAGDTRSVETNVSISASPERGCPHRKLMFCRHVYALAVLLLLGSRAIVADDPALTIERLAEGVYAFRPTDDAFKVWRAASNSAAVVLDDGVLFYDSHWTAANFAEAEVLLRRHTEKPIRYVVTSHYHGDHIGGLWAYPEGVEIISHHATRDRWLLRLVELPVELPKELAAQKTALEAATDPTEHLRIENLLHNGHSLLSHLDSDQAAPAPTLTFARKLELHRGRSVEVHFFGRGHTDGDAVVFLPEERIAFVGDLLFTDMVPNINDGYTVEWIATLESVLELGATNFLAGHGKVATVGDVREQIAYLQWLRGAVEPFVRSGAGVDSAVSGLTLPEEYAHYGLQWNLPGNIARVHDELEQLR